MIDRYKELENKTQKIIVEQLKPTLFFKHNNEGFLNLRIEINPDSRILFEDVAGRVRTAKKNLIKNEFVIYNPENEKKLIRIECKSQISNSDLTHRIYKLLGDVSKYGLDEDYLYIILGGYLATKEFKRTLKGWINDFSIGSKVMYGSVEKFEKFLIKYSK